MKSTVTFEQVNGYLVRVYPHEVEADTRLKYKTVVTIEIDGDTAIAKGCVGDYNRRNRDDIYTELKARGVRVLTWERFNSDGQFTKTQTVRIA
ncbi:MAG: hypothetical protein PHT48_09540 [Dechloromonas sp.]|nr:hypothetical protein [Dechloromonas sp.]